MDRMTAESLALEPTALLSPRNAYRLASICVRAQWHPDGGLFDDYDRMSQFKGGFIVRNRESIVVAFRGTIDRADRFIDMGTRFDVGPWGRVHQGFQDRLGDCWSKITQAIVEFQDKGQALWVTGHSLGAAVATLAVAHLRAPPNDKPVYGLYTFGSPRVGDREFERCFNADFKSCFRYVNDNDMVTRLPPRIAGFSHVGQLVYLDHAGDMHLDPAYWYRFVDSTKLDLSAHSLLEGYLPALQHCVLERAIV